MASKIGGGNVPDNEDSQGFAAAAAAAVVCGGEEGWKENGKGRCGGEKGGGGRRLFRASSDLSGRRYGSDGWCSVGPCRVDGDACLLRKQKRRFFFSFFFLFVPEIEEKIVSELALGPNFILKRNLIFNDRKTSLFSCKVHCRLA